MGALYDGKSRIPNCAKTAALQFDEAFVGWGMEDTDYALRLTKMGCRVLYAPYAVNSTNSTREARSKTPNF